MLHKRVRDRLNGSARLFPLLKSIEPGPVFPAPRKRPTFSSRLAEAHDMLKRGELGHGLTARLRELIQYVAEIDAPRDVQLMLYADILQSLQQLPFDNKEHGRDLMLFTARILSDHLHAQLCQFHPEEGGRAAGRLQYSILKQIAVFTPDGPHCGERFSNWIAALGPAGLTPAERDDQVVRIALAARNRRSDIGLPAIRELQLSVVKLLRGEDPSDLLRMIDVAFYGRPLS
jgi:hypothetical protein